MARLRLEQIISNLHYDRVTGELHVSGSSNPALILSGSMEVTGSLSIEGIDSFGDSDSSSSIDLGTF